MRSEFRQPAVERGRPRSRALAASIALLATSLGLGCGGVPSPTQCLAQAGLTAPADPLRPRFHYSPESGWMNDPSGLVFFAGEYHLFYQLNPEMPFWGEMHWGHAISTDLIHWAQLPIALAPNPRLGVVFSGSAVVDRANTSGLCAGGEGCLVAIFTHALGEDRKQKQSIAVSNDRGRTWQEYPGNPVIANPGLDDFRDPKVFWYGDNARWIMVLAAGDRARLYASTNLTAWTELSDFGPIAGMPAGKWEMPDLFPLPVEGTSESRWVLKVDVSAGPGQPSAGRYFVGTFDGARFTPDDSGAGRPFDFGSDFYAAQTFAGLSDRTVWMAWRDSWQYAYLVPTGTWRGAMSLPRELRLRLAPGGGHVLAQEPIHEAAALRAGCTIVRMANGTAAAVAASLAAVRADSFDLVAEIEPRGASRIELQFLKDGATFTSVGYDGQQQRVFVDRRTSGEVSFSSAFPARHEAPLVLGTGPLRLRVIVDRTSVEVFAGNGETVLTDSVYPPQSATGFALVTEGSQPSFKLLEIHPLRPAPVAGR